MANIAIWDGSSTFNSGSNPTPFGFYDTDPTFAADADKVSRFCAARLGYPLMDVELQSGSFYACFEESVTTYGNEVYLFKIRDNFLSLEATPTGSALNNTVISPNLGNMIRIAEDYGAEAGAGGFVNYRTGSFDLQNGKQIYDLDAWANASASLQPGDSIEIKEVFYQAPPAIVRYFDPYAGTGTGVQGLLETFGFGAYSPGVNFMMMPIYFDVQKIQAIELNDQIRKSAFSFNIVNNKLEIFPAPTDKPGTLFFRYISRMERGAPAKAPYSGSNMITNISNVPFNNPTYSQINAPGRQWVFLYTLALAKELLGYVRGKYTTVPIPGAETTLNQSDLLTDARTEKAALLEKLRGDLDEATRQKQLERRQAENVAMKSTFENVPLPIFIG
jgi:hypothetical protein